jgi:hypothetical protein
MTVKGRGLRSMEVEAQPGDATNAAQLIPARLRDECGSWRAPARGRSWRVVLRKGGGRAAALQRFWADCWWRFQRSRATKYPSADLGFVAAVFRPPAFALALVFASVYVVIPTRGVFGPTRDPSSIPTLANSEIITGTDTSPAQACRAPERGPASRFP